MQPLVRRVSDFLRGVVWWADYIAFNVTSSLGKKDLPKDVKKILIVEMLYIGDLIAITPVIRALKGKFPQAKIEVMVRPAMREVLSNNPNVSYILSYTHDEIEENFDDVAYRLEMENYDLAVLLHPGIDYGSWMMSKLLRKAKIPFRIGCTRVGFLEGRGFFLHRKTKPCFALKHKTEDNLDVIKAIGIRSHDLKMDVHLSKDAKQNVAKFLKRHEINNDNFVVVIHPIPQHLTHRWDNDKFAEVADKIAKSHAKVIITGAEIHEEAVNDIVTRMRKKAVKAVGLPLKEYFAVIKRADVVISVDTSAMHIASAFNKPVITLFGAGNPHIWRPLCDKSIVIYKDEYCTSCMKHKCRFLKNLFLNKERAYECMKTITVYDVMDAFEKIKKA